MVSNTHRQLVGIGQYKANINRSKDQRVGGITLVVGYHCHVDSWLHLYYFGIDGEMVGTFWGLVDTTHCKAIK